MLVGNCVEYCFVQKPALKKIFSVFKGGKCIADSIKMVSRFPRQSDGPPNKNLKVIHCFF